MKTTNDDPSQPARPRALRRRADHSLFANCADGPRLPAEDPAGRASVRSAVETVKPSANELERLFAEQAARN